MFWRFTELHYSQTLCVIFEKEADVLEIYRITLLSNGVDGSEWHCHVLEIYRITLLSNGSERIVIKDAGFGDLQNYTTLKL